MKDANRPMLVATASKPRIKSDAQARLAEPGRDVNQRPRHSRDRYSVDFGAVHAFKLAAAVYDETDCPRSAVAGRGDLDWLTTALARQALETVQSGGRAMGNHGAWACPQAGCR